MLIVLMIIFLRVLFNAVFAKGVGRIITKYRVLLVQTLAYLFKFK